MIARYFDALFRHKWLLLLPPLLIPIVVATIAIARTPPTYQAFTAVWVDRPRYLATQDDSSSFWVTPAQFQAARLSEMIQTRSFLNSVASRTSLAPLVGTEWGEQRIREVVTRGIQVTPRGERLLVISFAGESAQLAFQSGNAIVEEFRDRSINERSTQAAFAMAFVESRLHEAEARLASANDALRKHVAANPRLTSLDPSRSAANSAAGRSGLPTAAIDPQLAELLKSAEIEQREVERARGTVEQARYDATAGVEAQDMRFQIIDPARLPTSPTTDRRKMLMFVAIAAIAGLSISATLAVFLVATDRTIRSEAEIDGPYEVIGMVPSLSSQHRSRSTPEHLARLQVGLPAGTVLPNEIGAA